MKFNFLFQRLESFPPVNLENFDVLFNTYGACVYGIILKVVDSDVELAEKLTGRAFVAIYQKKRLYDPKRQRLLVWIIVVIAALLREHGYIYQCPPVLKKTPEPVNDRINFSSLVPA